MSELFISIKRGASFSHFLVCLKTVIIGFKKLSHFGMTDCVILCQKLF